MYGTVTNSQERVDRYLVPRLGELGDDRLLLTMWNAPSITSGYNKFLEHASRTGPQMLVLLHDDLELIDPRAEEKLLAAVSQLNVAIAGVAGGRGVFSLAWWEAPVRFGWQLTDSGPLEFGPRTGDVDSLEGSLLAFSPWAYQNLRYDERMTGFHCCDEICIRASAAGKRVVVADVDTHHHTTLGFRSPEAQREWFANDAIYREREGL